MAQVVNNFIRTTLAVAISPSATTLQLATGGGALFDIPAGDWCYITVNDSTTVEVMKYVSTGSEAGDIIGVLRGQDNTTPKAFPAGACVAVGWNTAQVSAFIEQETGGGGTGPAGPTGPAGATGATGATGGGGGTGSGMVAILSKGFITTSGSVFTSGAYPYALLSLSPLIAYDPGSTGVLSYSSGRIKFNANCIASLTAMMHGEIYAPDQPNPFFAEVNFTHTGGTDLIGNNCSIPSTGAGYPTEAIITAVTPPMVIAVNDEWDANLLIYALVPSFARVTMKQLMISASVYVLT